MRIAAVGTYADIGWILGDEVLAAEGLQNPLLNLEFMGAAIVRAAPDFLEGTRGDRVDLGLRLVVDGDLLFRKRSLEAGYKVG